MADNKRLVLVDGSSYLFRAFHALPPLTSSKGVPTGAVKGVIAMIRKLMADNPESPVAVVFDPRGGSFRNELYPEYKANRAKMPDDLRSQIEPIHTIIRLMGLPLLVVDGVEADDVIGTLATEARAKGVEVLISTGDKDMAQLVSPEVTLINTMNDSVMDEAGVEEKFGVRPDQIIDYLALVGDTSDNIPGVPKCGPKTAAKWLRQFETLDGVIEHAEDVKGKVGENLRASLDTLPLSYQLATIKLDVEMELGVGDLAHGEPDVDTLRDIFTDLEFKQWADELAAEAAADVPPAEYETVLDEPALAALAGRLNGSDRIALAVHTDVDDYMKCRLLGLSFSARPGQAAYIPLAATDARTLDAGTVLRALRETLEDGSIAKVGHDLKFAMSVLAANGVTLAGAAGDTMLRSYVFNSVGSQHGLDDLVMKYLGRNKTRYEDIGGKGAKRKALDELALDVASPYAAEAADLTLQVDDALTAKLEADDALNAVYSGIELPLVGVLSRMERHGVMVDPNLLMEQSAELAERMEALEREAHDMAGEVFNLSSTKQLQEVFFEKLGLPVLKKTPKGQPSTAEPVLQELALDYPLPALIMEYRGLSKLKSTYTDQLPREIDQGTGRIHTSYRQAVAATGRLSSVDPNLQNIPIRTDEGRRVRRAFVAPPVTRLLAADYSQIELRIMAHLSQDAGLLDAFAQGLDIHRATAAEVFGESIETVQDDQRRSAKAINFGLIYGMSAFGLANQLGISRASAQEYIDLYFDRYPGVQDYMERTRSFAADEGYVETLFGRRLYLPEIKASNYMRRQGAERQAINAPMQGTAADIIKRAMVTVDRWLTDREPASRMIMQVHDELVLEVPEGDVDRVGAGVSQLMSDAASLAVPLVVKVGVGSDWDAAH
ncbi:MAG: DNA polymerase I [Gammaproteobacteria bacterium]|nr:DNA polymerase I [Gammaproteobacteria bacterium]